MASTMDHLNEAPDPNDRIGALAAELARQHARRSEADENITRIKDELKVLTGENFKEGIKFATPDGVVVACVRRTGRRFDTLKAGAELPQGVIDQISTMQIDPKVAKVKLPKDVYDELLSEGGLSIVVK